jgi:hypothetical protein
VTVTVEDGPFRIPILFFTQSRARAHVLNGSIPPDKCTRKPKTIAVSLIANDQEYDRVSFDMDKDFKKIELSAYALRSEILLHGPEGTTPQFLGLAMADNPLELRMYWRFTQLVPNRQGVEIPML